MHYLNKEFSKAEITHWIDALSFRITQNIITWLPLQTQRLTAKEKSKTPGISAREKKREGNFLFQVPQKRSPRGWLSHFSFSVL